MHRERLFERIIKIDIDPNQRYVGVDSATEVKSIISHINILLSARRGSTLIADDYGISDISYFKDGEFVVFEDTNELNKMIKKDLA